MGIARSRTKIEHPFVRHAMREITLDVEAPEMYNERR